MKCIIWINLLCLQRVKLEGYCVLQNYELKNHGVYGANRVRSRSFNNFVPEVNKKRISTLESEGK